MVEYKQKISCIVPAYNEGARIGKVLRALYKNKAIDELIVVNDGSKDDTESEIRKFKGVKLITYKKNGGKSYAIMRGLKASKNKLVMFIDSDLVGLREKDIVALAKPVLEDKADISISLRKNSLNIYKFFSLDFISGERVFKKELLGNLDEIGKLRSFGLESFMNKRIIKNKLRIKVVKWDNVISPRKSKKMGFFHGMVGDIKMIKQIIKTVGFFGMISIFFNMKKLIVK